MTGFNLKNTWVQVNLDFPRLVCRRWLTCGALSRLRADGWFMSISHNNTQTSIQYKSRATGSKNDLVLAYKYLFSTSWAAKKSTGLERFLQFNVKGATGEFLRPLYLEFSRHPPSPAVDLQRPWRELFSRYEGPTSPALKLACDPFGGLAWPDACTQLSLGSRLRTSAQRQVFQQPAGCRSDLGSVGFKRRAFFLRDSKEKPPLCNTRANVLGGKCNVEAGHNDLGRFQSLGCPDRAELRRITSPRQEQPSSAVQQRVVCDSAAQKLVGGGLSQLLYPEQRSHGLDRIGGRCSLLPRTFGECPSWGAPEERARSRTGISGKSTSGDSMYPNNNWIPNIALKRPSSCQFYLHLNH